MSSIIDDFQPSCASDLSQANECEMRWEELLQSNPSVSILLSLSDEARSSLRDNVRDAVSQLFDDDLSLIHI